MCPAIFTKNGTVLSPQVPTGHKQVHLLDTVPHYVTLYFLQRTSPQMCILFLWHSNQFLVTATPYKVLRLRSLQGLRLTSFEVRQKYLIFGKLQKRSTSNLAVNLFTCLASTNLRLAPVEQTTLPRQWGQQTAIVHSFSWIMVQFQDMLESFG